jgi:Protein of unknown function (DUF3551)
MSCPNFLSQEWGPHMKDAVSLLCTGLAVGAIVLAAPARAQTYDPKYPVCLQVYEGMVNYYFECSYTTMAQCAASASGRSASCVVNPYYAKPASRKKQPHK